MTTDAGPPGGLPPGMTPREQRGPDVLAWLRTSMAVAVGVVAVVLLTLAGVLAVFALVVATPEHPGRSFAVLLSVPELRHDAAEELVADVEHRRGSAFGSTTREALVEAVDGALDDAAVLDSLASIRLEDGHLDPTGYLAAIARDLGALAAHSTDPELRRVLSGFAEELPVVAATPEGEGHDIAAGLREVRRYGVIGSIVVAVAALVALLVAVAVAVRRGPTAAAVVSSALVLTALVLAPGEWLLGLGDGPGGAVAQLVAAAGAFAGPGVVWSLLLGSLVPPALWWAVRAHAVAGQGVRVLETGESTQRARSAITS